MVLRNGAHTQHAQYGDSARPLLGPAMHYQIEYYSASINVRCLYCLVSHGHAFYQLPDNLSHSCLNSIDTAVLDCSHLLLGY